MVVIYLNYRSLPDTFASLHILFGMIFCVCGLVLILIFFPQAVISLVDQTGREKVKLHVDD